MESHKQDTIITLGEAFHIAIDGSIFKMSFPIPIKYSIIIKSLDFRALKWNACT